MSYSDSDDQELGHNITLHYEGGGKGETSNETFIRRTYNNTGKDSRERVFKSSGWVMLTCLIIAAVMLIIFSCFMTSLKNERAVLDANDIALGSFVNWRMFLYKAELVITPLVMICSRIKNYNILMVGWVLYIVIWFCGIVNCIIG